MALELELELGSAASSELLVVSKTTFLTPPASTIFSVMLPDLTPTMMVFGEWKPFGFVCESRVRLLVGRGGVAEVRSVTASTRFASDNP